MAHVLIAHIITVTGIHKLIVEIAVGFIIKGASTY